MNTDVKRLYRSRTERMIGGVCGGLGEFLNIDVTLVRLLFVLCAIFGGPGLVVYLVVPCVWLSGGEVVRQTGLSWIASPLYWGRIAVGLVLPLAVIAATKTVSGGLWVPILAGELMGRAVFFANTVHTATNMGGLY